MNYEKNKNVRFRTFDKFPAHWRSIFAACVAKRRISYPQAWYTRMVRP